ncbi:MAG TPA: TetR/AcrR family transcriptional regulator [Solirubrobacteraceae bacterium]|nr:TetR/AcrR family transcriptional regulator [Solirubrobacteraceae bacterium]
MSGHSNSAGAGTPGSDPATDRPRRHSRSTDAEQAILDATERLLADTSLHELSVAQIIASAGISRATFYFYFGSKFAVLTALVDRAIGEILQVSQQSLERARGLPTELALRQRIQASARIWEANRPVLQATVENWNAIAELRSVWLRALGRLTDGLASEIDRERATGRAPGGPDSRSLAATLVWTTERCLYVSGLGLGDALDGEANVVDALTRIWLGAMYGAGDHVAAA